MHEWAIAEGIVATVLKNSGGRKVKKVKVRVGELQQIDLEVLKLAVGEISKVEQAEEIKIEIEIERTEFECNRCHKRWNLSYSCFDAETAELVHFLPESSKIYSRCPRCGSSDFEIARGRGVWIESFVIRE